MYQLYQEVIRKNNPKAEKSLLELRKVIGHQPGKITFTDPKTGKQKSTTLEKLAKRVASTHKFSYFLYKLINHLQCKTVLETGTSLGINTAYLARSIADTIVTIEGSEKLSNIAKTNFKNSGIQNIKVIRGLVRDVFEDTLVKFKPELVFLDADHRGETIKFYLDRIKNVDSVKCIIIHDIYWSEDMHQARCEVVKDKKYSLTIDIFQAGIIFPNYHMEKQHFSLKF